MTEQKSERDQRAGRLRIALRENLRRRKVQAKARRQDGAGDAGDDRCNPPGSPTSAGFAADKPKD
jgi:hypothetical protein